MLALLWQSQERQRYWHRHYNAGANAIGMWVPCTRNLGYDCDAYLGCSRYARYARETYPGSPRYEGYARDAHLRCSRYARHAWEAYLGCSRHVRYARETCLGHPRYAGYAQETYLACLSIFVAISWIFPVGTKEISAHGGERNNFPQSIRG